MIKHILRKMRRTLFPLPTLDVVAYFAEAFPGVEKKMLLAPRSIPTLETQKMRFKPFFKYVDSSTYETPEVYSALLQDVYFCPVNSCITTPDHRIVAESTGPSARAADLDRQALARERPVERLEGFCTSLQCSYADHYHFLIDNLSRFDLLNHPFFERFDEIRLLCPRELSPLEAYFVSRLRPPNVTVRVLDRDKLYHVENYIFNAFTTTKAAGFVQKSFVDRMRSEVCAGFERTPRSRVYISRAKAKKGRRVLNEHALMTHLRRVGFEKYILEDLSIEDQIEILAKAEWIVGPHGAGLANMLFAKDAKVIELFGCYHVAPHFYLLSKALDHRYAFICGEEEYLDENFRVDIERVMTAFYELEQGGYMRKGAPAVA